MLVTDPVHLAHQGLSSAHQSIHRTCTCTRKAGYSRATVFEMLNQPFGTLWRKGLVSLPRLVPDRVLKYTTSEGPQPFVIKLPSRGKHRIPVYVWVPPCILTGNLPVDGLPVLLDFHGGGFVLGTPLEQAQFCAKFAREQGILAISVDYRLGPYDRFPAALEDAEDVLSLLLDPASDGHQQLLSGIRQHIHRMYKSGGKRSRAGTMDSVISNGSAASASQDDLRHAAAHNRMGHSGVSNPHMDPHAQASTISLDQPPHVGPSASTLSLVQPPSHPAARFARPELDRQISAPNVHRHPVHHHHHHPTAPEASTSTVSLAPSMFGSHLAPPDPNVPYAIAPAGLGAMGAAHVPPKPQRPGLVSQKSSTMSLRRLRSSSPTRTAALTRLCTHVSINSRRIALSGFSSGGNLALNLVLSLPPTPPYFTEAWPTRFPPAQTHKIPVLLYYPSFDCRQLPSERPRPAVMGEASKGFFSNLGINNTLMPTYLPRELGGHPRASPGLAAIKTEQDGSDATHGLHPQAAIALIIPEVDTLAAQAESWIDKVHEAGREEILVARRYPGMKHGWTQFPDMILGEKERRDKYDSFSFATAFVHDLWGEVPVWETSGAAAGASAAGAAPDRLSPRLAAGHSHRPDSSASSTSSPPHSPSLSHLSSRSTEHKSGSQTTSHTTSHTTSQTTTNTDRNLNNLTIDPHRQSVIPNAATPVDPIVLNAQSAGGLVPEYDVVAKPAAVQKQGRSRFLRYARLGKAGKSGKHAKQKMPEPNEHEQSGDGDGNSDSEPFPKWEMRVQQA